MKAGELYYSPFEAEDGRLGDMQDDPTLLSGSDHHADGEKRGAG